MKTDKQIFNDVFKVLRKKGYVARQNYMCCQSCAWASVETDYDTNDDSNIVFYHAQDASSFEDGKLKEVIHLAWQGNGDFVKLMFEKHGFNVVWDGTQGKRIGILPRGTVYEVKYKDGQDRMETVHAFSEDKLDYLKRTIDGYGYELVEVNEVKERAFEGV